MVEFLEPTATPRCNLCLPYGVKQVSINACTVSLTRTAFGWIGKDSRKMEIFD